MPIAAGMDDASIKKALQDSNDIVERLKAHCNGHPHAKVPWPHRILHEAADEIERLRQALRINMLRHAPQIPHDYIDAVLYPKEKSDG